MLKKLNKMVSFCSFLLQQEICMMKKENMIIDYHRWRK